MAPDTRKPNCSSQPTARDQAGAALRATWPGAIWPASFSSAQATEQAASASLMWLEVLESWLGASRQMIDLWRISLREQQDAMLLAWRKQIVSDVVEAELREAPVPAPAASPAEDERLPARSRSAVARSPELAVSSNL